MESERAKVICLIEFLGRKLNLKNIFSLTSFKNHKMACYLNENVYTHTFTPREYQVELLDSAKKRNTVVCTSTSSSKAFLLVKLLQEFSWQMRSQPHKKTLLILDPQNVPVLASHVEYLTDLKVISISEEYNENIEVLFKDNHVIVTTAEMCTKTNILLQLGQYVLVFIDDCLYGNRQVMIIEIMNKYRQLDDCSKPRILGMTTGMLGSELQSDRLEAELRRLERLLASSVDTSSEIVTLIRLSCHPKEHIITCHKISLPLHNELTTIIEKCKEFLQEHRYDPSEIYDEEFLDEIKDIPDPKNLPLELLNNYLEILEDLGPWGADRAAINILSKIEKLKVNIENIFYFNLYTSVF